MDFGIKGKYALVTGGSHGIGYCTAEALARAGCNVAICARRENVVLDAAAAIREKYNVETIGISVDVMIPEDIEKCIRTILESWGTLHILVNNVGGGGRWGTECIEDTAESVWMDVFSKNALAAIRFTMAVIPLMRTHKWGRVVTVTSIYGREGGGRPWFNLAKAAETSLMKTLAMQRYLIRDGITFNSVAPGNIMIPDTGWANEQGKDEIAFKAMMDHDFTMGRLGRPEEVADVIAFLCSEQASFVNGAAVAVDGGQSRAF